MSLTNLPPAPLTLPDDSTLKRTGAEVHLGIEAATAHEGYVMHLTNLREAVHNVTHAGPDDVQNILARIHSYTVHACKAWHHYRSALLTMEQHGVDPDHALNRAGRMRRAA